MRSSIAARWCFFALIVARSESYRFSRSRVFEGTAIEVSLLATAFLRRDSDGGFSSRDVLFSAGRAEYFDFRDRARHVQRKCDPKRWNA